jgi:hypothetical protein
MRGSRLFAAIFAVSLAASAETLSVAQLLSFLQSSQTLIQQGKMTDHELAKFLDKVKLSERLDDRTLENIEGEVTLGPKTLVVLHKLSDESASLTPAAKLVAPPKPKPIPPPSSEEQAAIIDDIRQYSLNYTDGLPDFICTQVTRRYGAPLPGTKYGGPVGGDPRWQSLDTLQIRLSFFQKKEQYKVVLVNNSIVNQDYEKLGGSKSFGEFGSMLQQIFEPHSHAHFEWDHWGTLRGKRVMAFRYHVPLDSSQYRIVVDNNLGVIVGYTGVVEVDPQSHEVMRVTTEAENIPADFPVRKATDVLDYDYQELSGHKFLLPLKAQVLMQGPDSLQRLDEEFRLYRKYAAESDIKFDSEPIAPLPEDKTKETRDPGAPVQQPAPGKQQ